MGSYLLSGGRGMTMIVKTKGVTEWTMIIWTLRGRMCYKYSLSAKEIIFLSERNSFLKIGHVCEDKTLESSFQRKENLRKIVAADRNKKKNKNIICSPVHLWSPLTI